MDSSDPGVHRALAAPARRALLAALTEAAEPLDIRRLAGLLDLHITTVRHHLTALVEAGLVEVRPQGASGRGRPRLTYVAAPAREQLDAYRTLVDVLSAGYGPAEAERSARAERAGRSWGAAEPGTGGTLADQVLAEAGRWGFRPEAAPDGSQVLLHGCPFLPNAQRHPEVVCSVHQGLLAAMAERAGRPGALSLRPFSAPGVCAVLIAPVGGHHDGELPAGENPHGQEPPGAGPAGAGGDAR